MSSVEVRQVITQRDLRTFVKFPWQIYKGDANWVPPLISERIEYLDPSRGPFYEYADVALFLARQGGKVVGTVASFVNRRPNHEQDPAQGGFGFFEAIDDDQVVKSLLDAAFDWLRARGMKSVSGPMCFTNNEYPGVLFEETDCPPVMLAAHTPLYYKDLLERYGMEKDHDLYAWRAFRWQIGEELEKLPPELRRVADVAKRVAQVQIRKLRMNEWDQEIEIARQLFNTTLSHLAEHVPLSVAEFRRLASQLRPFIDPELALFAEADGKTVGFCVAIPDVNRVLIHLNGRLFPLGWIKVWRHIRRIDVVSFKLMGVLEEYRRRGIDALLYLETIKAFYERGYEWLDGSMTSELNPTINLIAQRLGAERYKQYRLFKMAL